ncbi:MAG: TIGR03557 family F420-dependent LLM class oxidoreductase [Actinobacteria bacterium]|nr:TIGR03557 family F420-dependent LLM class oxidoreductase [Actinomycetota bacterium]
MCTDPGGARVEVGYWLASEEYGPRELVAQAQAAREHGLTRFAISDHYHPWTESQGHSPFVWSVIAAVAATVPDAHVTTFVTCPTLRIHPAVVAQAAATSSLLLDGRFTFGLGSGENLNEHVLGDRWPHTDERHAMLEEAVEVMRRLWSGDQVTHEGRHYTVVNARLYDPPAATIPVPISAFGPKALDLAARVNDGYVASGPMADLVDGYRGRGGEGPVIGGFKVCFRDDEDEARELAHRMWPNESMPGELAQELPTVAHMEQAVSNVTVDDVAGSVVCGPDPEAYLGRLREFEDAGFDVVHVQPIGGRVGEFLGFLTDEVLPRR